MSSCLHSTPACYNCGKLSMYNNGVIPNTFKEWYYSKASSPHGSTLHKSVFNKMCKSEKTYNEYLDREKSIFGRLFNKISGDYGDGPFC